MKIEIHENLLTIKEEDGTVIKTVNSTSFVIYPAEGKKLRNKLTGYVTDSFVGVSNKSDISKFEEI